MRVVAVFDDLLLGSNVLGMLRARGFEASLSGADAHPDGADALIVDLASTGFDGVELVERLRAAGELEATRTLGVYSHVDVDTRRRAEAAGFDLVVPRSRMAREGAALVERLRGEGELGDTRTLGVYSHVDADTKRRADAAGFDLVVPRSRMAREGPALVERLASA